MSRVRAHYRTTSASPAVRQRYARLLGEARLETPGLPPSAILIVRRLADPLPRRMVAGSDAMHVALHWERAVQEALAERRRAAVRPIAGAAARSADAVLFADRAELLACLARDLAAGKAADCWWWEAILRDLPAAPVQALVEAWGREARYVPPALEMLTGRGEALDVLARMAPAQAWRLFAAVAVAYDLGGLTTVRAAAPRRTQVAFQGQTPGVAAPFRALTAPWDDLASASEVPGSLPMEAQALAGIALGLARQPAVLRSRAFRAHFQDWLHVAAVVPPERAGPADSVAMDSDPARPPGTSDEQQGPRQATKDVPARPAMEAPRADAVRTSKGGQTPPKPKETDRATARADVATPVPLVAGTPGQAAATTGLSIPDSSRRSQDGAPPAPRSDPPRNREAERLPGRPSASKNVPFLGSPASPHPAELPAEGADMVAAPRLGLPSEVASAVPAADGLDDAVPSTSLGGVFFLINLMRRLDFLTHLETQFGVACGLGGWGWLALWARYLLLDAGLDGDDDPVWGVLADLEGQASHDPPGWDFVGRDRYRLPASWLDTHDGPCGAPVHLVRRGAWWALCTERGYALAARRFGSRHDPQALRAWCDEEGCRLAEDGAAWNAPARLRAMAHPAALARNDDLRDFMAFLLPVLRWRIAQALGVAARAFPEAVQSLLQRRATVIATRSHVDVMMSLDEVSVPVRLAGLDVDPGWIPALGRVVLFHYD